MVGRHVCLQIGSLEGEAGWKPYVLEMLVWTLSINIFKIQLLGHRNFLKGTWYYPWIAFIFEIIISWSIAKSCCVKIFDDLLIFDDLMIFDESSWSTKLGGDFSPSILDILGNIAVASDQVAF